MRAALEWALDRGDPSLRARARRQCGLGLGAERFHDRRAGWMTRALEEAGHPESVFGAMAIGWLSMFASRRGTSGWPSDTASGSRDLLEKLGEQRRRVGRSWIWQTDAFWTGDVEQARRHID